MVLNTSGPLSIGNGVAGQDIPLEFGIPATTPFPTGYYGLGGAPSSGALSLSDFYGRSAGGTPTPTPTPAPAFTAQPTVSPGSGTAGATTFTATPGTVSNSTGNRTRSWLYNGTALSTGLTAAPPAGAGGTLTYQEFDGSAASNVISIPVSASSTQPTFVPATSGTYGEDGYRSASYTLTCDPDATWTYSGGGPGGTVSVPYGGTSKVITFRLQQGPGGQARAISWNVTGTVGGTSRSYTIELSVEGDGVGGTQ